MVRAENELLRHSTAACRSHRQTKSWSPPARGGLPVTNSGCRAPAPCLRTTSWRHFATAGIGQPSPRASGSVCAGGGSPGWRALWCGQGLLLPAAILVGELTDSGRILYNAPTAEKPAAAWSLTSEAGVMVGRPRAARTGAHNAHNPQRYGLDASLCASNI